MHVTSPTYYTFDGCLMKIPLMLLCKKLLQSLGNTVSVGDAPKQVSLPSFSISQHQSSPPVIPVAA